MQARWAEGENARNTELCFTCTVRKYAAATLRFIAKDVYNVYVNGAFVQYGPARAAKGYARVDELSLTPYLTKEENVLCVYVQSNYTRTLCFALEKPLFAAEIIVDGETVLTTDDFRCFEMTDKLQKVEKMSSQRGFVEVYRMKKNREPFDLTAFPECILTPVEMPNLLERNVSMATHAPAFGRLVDQGGVTVDATRVWENDFTRQLDTGKNLFSYTRSECDCVCSKEILSFVFDRNRAADEYRYETYSFGRVYCGKFRLKVTVKGNASIWLAYDDILIDSYVKFNREQIIHALKWELEEGEYLLYSNEVYTAQYLALVFHGDVTVEEVATLRVENPDTENCTFTCADKGLESIVEAARHSFQHNGYDLLTDCPSRERAGYLCDGFFSARAESFFCGNNPVEKNLLENYLLYKNAHFTHDGILPMCYPSVPTDKDDFIPNWVLWYVMELEDYVDRTNDKAFVMQHAWRIRLVLDYFQGLENEFGLLENLGGWVFVEWSKANDFVDGVNFPSNMCYYGVLRAAAKLLGDSALAEKAEKLKSTIIEKSYNGKFFVDNALRENGVLKVTENVSETCQNYAAFFNVFTREENPEFYQRLIGELGCFHRENFHPDVHASNMFIGYILRLSILLREGERAAVLAECKNRFLSMAEETGTIWELFQTNASCDHGFGAVVGQMIVYAVTGLVRVDEKEKTVYFSKEYEKIDTKATIPLREGTLTVSLETGARSVETTGGYHIKVV